VRADNLLYFAIPFKTVKMIKNISVYFSRLLFAGLVFYSRSLFAADVTIIDSRHYSNVFGEIRNFRIFLPPGYNANHGKRYPVIYYYHGWSQRYFGSGADSYVSIDQGNDNNGDNIANFVAGHDVIVVKPDGYNRSPSEDYYLRPYNVLPVETFRQFPIYFPELVKFIDTNYMTIPDRNHRAISGLSMGGFMSFWIGGKYPHLISAIGNFCGSPEFVVGPKDFPAEYRHIDMYNNYAGINVRLNFGDEDFIRFYHRDMNRIWTQVMDNYQYKVYKASHSTCGLAEMYEFIMKTFENPPEKPLKWDHIDVYPEFSVWDYNVSSDRDVTGFTILENVDFSGFRCSVRGHLPDGELLPFVALSVTTPPVYEKNILYTINDIDQRTGEELTYTLKSDNVGSLRISFDGSMHEIGINKTGDKANICLASFTREPGNISRSGQDVLLRINLLNKGIIKGEEIKAVLSATRSTASVIKEESDFGTIEKNSTAESKSAFIFHVSSDTTEIERFKVKITDKHNNEWVQFLEIPMNKNNLPDIKEFEIADGKIVTVAREGINTETAMLGKGNGDGAANPGESIVILSKDKGKLWRTNLICSNKYVNPFGVNTRISDNWAAYDHVGGSAKYSVPLISSECPVNQTIDFIAEYWLPDSPNHIIKQGKVTIKVTGRDNTPPEMKWLKITGDNVLQARLIDGAPIKNVKAKLIIKDKPERKLDIVLLDDGTNGDRAKSDNVFSFKISEQKFGIYTVEITASDSFGNTMKTTAPGTFVIH
jgi:S-formylglutathione hydrolase FrmB